MKLLYTLICDEIRKEVKGMKLKVKMRSRGRMLG